MKSLGNWQNFAYYSAASEQHLEFSLHFKMLYYTTPVQFWAIMHCDLAEDMMEFMMVYYSPWLCFILLLSFFFHHPSIQTSTLHFDVCIFVSIFCLFATYSPCCVSTLAFTQWNTLR